MCLGRAFDHEYQIIGKPSAQLRHIDPGKSYVSASVTHAEASLASGEFFTLFSHMLQRGAQQLTRHLRHGPSVAALRGLAYRRPGDDVAALDDVGEKTIVLRTLIEEFGGEAVSSSLGRRMVHLVRWKEGKFDLWMREVLGDLEQCGALTLEAMHGTEMIARIEPAGVILAYDRTALSQVCGPAI
ncbi:MAG: hypothetical protein C0524_12025 [Rhodobacter sp.]|nr:hypothetical protein [Rhodobacter sp.]